MSTTQYLSPLLMQASTVSSTTKESAKSFRTWPFPTPGESKDEVLPRPSMWNGQPIAALLTSEEVVTGCIIYQVQRNALAPHLLADDLIVAQPLAREEWFDLQAGYHYVVIEQMRATRSFLEPAYLVEQIVCVTSLTKKILYGLADMGNGDAQEAGFVLRNLFGVYRVSRLIRPL